MGVSISEIIPKKEIELSALRGKTIAIDAYNTLYQFLTTIRQFDGTPLMDSKGNITSHLSGLFYRNLNLLQEGIKPVYVFDGKSPDLKKKEIERRKELKEIAQAKFVEASKVNDTNSMKKYSSRNVKITDEILEQSKELLTAMGILSMQADSEGEAEAVELTKKGFVWASASQDYDSLIYGSPILIRNLTLSRRKKTPSGDYIDINIEEIKIKDVLEKLEINQDQLICLAILVGTDYNPSGVKGLGQKRALEIVKEYKTPEEIFKFIDSSEKYELDFNWEEIFKIFKEYHSEIKELPEFPMINPEKIKKILIKYEFSETRIESALEKLNKIKEQKKQKDLGEFF